MINHKIDLGSFSRNTKFYGEIDLVLTIKSFDLQAIRARYIKSKNNVSGKAGSVERRAVSKGGVAKVKLTRGKLEEQTLVGNLSEPRGIDYKDSKFALSLENTVYVFASGSIYQLQNPWFSYIHTVDFEPNKDDSILITSSGFECLHEYNFKSKTLNWEWFAWENGLNEGNNPSDNTKVFLTRSAEKAKEYENENVPHVLISDPKSDALPTAKRAAFINTAKYDSKDPDHIFLTLFHEGSSRYLIKKTGESEILMDKMKSPHGSHRYSDDMVMATNTGGGTVELLAGETRTSLEFKNLANKPEELGETEWLQNSIKKDNLIITIDSNRNSLVIIDLERKQYDMISYDNNWAVQDLMTFNQENESIIDQALEYMDQLK